MFDWDWSLSGKNGRSGLVAVVYVVATRGKLLKGTSREQAFLQKRPVAIKHFCERDQSRSQITTSNYKLNMLPLDFSWYSWLLMEALTSPSTRGSCYVLRVTCHHKHLQHISLSLSLISASLALSKIWRILVILSLKKYVYRAFHTSLKLIKKYCRNIFYIQQHGDQSRLRIQ